MFQIPILMILAHSISSLALGNVTCGVPNPNFQRGLSTMQTYFSGTNCFASGIASTNNTPFEWVTDASLYLNGELVREVHGRNDHYTPAMLSVNFDSTHFPDGSILSVRMEATSNMGNTGTFVNRGTVYNKATLYGRNEWEANPAWASAGVPAANQWLTTILHTTAPQNITKGWDSNAVLNDIIPGTVFYVNTHGNNSPNPLFLSDSDELTHVQEFVFPNSSYSTTNQVLEYRKLAVGSGTPPFNSGLPPVNLAFLDACLTGLDNAFADAFLWPYTNYFSNSYTVDQAEVGWRICGLISATARDGQAFWGALAQGYTAHMARDMMVTAYYSPMSPPSATSIVSVWGDYYTRLHTVYTSDDTPSGWFR